MYETVFSTVKRRKIRYHGQALHSRLIISAPYPIAPLTTLLGATPRHERERHAAARIGDRDLLERAV